ncbi:MAG: hypothetical protein ACK47M_09830 [Caldilinea sp.]
MTDLGNFKHGDSRLKVISTESDSQSWFHFITNWDMAPVLIDSIPSGDVYAYVLDGVTRYRLVPDPYAVEDDAFYTTFTGGVLSGLIVTRG